MKKITPIILISFLAGFNSFSFAEANPPGNPPSEQVTPTPEEKPSSPLSGNFTITSNYMFRGISNSNNLPAFQGGYTYTFPIGLYFNLWGSNVNFLDSQGNTATVEIDTIAGFKRDIGEHFTYDFSIAHYSYPKTVASYNEFLANFAFYFLTAQIGYSSNVYNTHANGTYYNIGFNYDIPYSFIRCNDLNIKGGIGHYSLPSSAGLSSYDDYSLQLSKTIGMYVLALQYTNTNGKSVDNPPLRNDHLVVSVAANF